MRHVLLACLAGCVEPSLVECSNCGVAAMTAATSLIDPGGVLVDQYPQVRAALRAAVTVAFAADGAPAATAQR